MHESLNVYDCLCLIMFDVKLTPVVCLPICMNGWTACMIDLLACLVSCLRISRASFVYLF